MSKFDPKAALSRAKTAPQARVRPGAVYLILDEVINWPKARDAQRGHTQRFVIVLQDQELCLPDRGPQTVMVIPCSSSGSGGAAPWDFLIPDGESGFDKTHVIAYVSLVQPILKTDLNQYLGQVSKATVEEIKVRAQWLMAIQRSPLKLPERSAVDTTIQPVAASLAVTATHVTLGKIQDSGEPH